MTRICRALLPLSAPLFKNGPGHFIICNFDFTSPYHAPDHDDCHETAAFCEVAFEDTYDTTNLKCRGKVISNNDGSESMSR